MAWLRPPGSWQRRGIRRFLAAWFVNRRVDVATLRRSCSSNRGVYLRVAIRGKRTARRTDPSMILRPSAVCR